jgi:hypothetical protein
VKQTQNVCFVTSPDSVLNPESAPIEVPLVFKDNSVEIDTSIVPVPAPLGEVHNYTKDGFPPDNAILMIGPKFNNAGVKSRDRVTQVQHNTVKAAQLEVCNGERYTTAPTFGGT